MALIDFTLFNARRFYLSMGNPLGLKGLRKRYTISSASSFLSFMERTDHLGFKDVTIRNKRL